jgi:hypothetical protein
MQMGAGQWVGVTHDAKANAITIPPTTAIVEVDTALPGNISKGHLAMVKMDGKWQTISKSFHEY